MGTIPYPYLDEFVDQLLLRPEVENLHFVTFCEQGVGRIDRHRRSLSLGVDATTARQMLSMQHAYKDSITRLGGGPDTTQRGVATIQATLTQHVIAGLCIELAADLVHESGTFNHAIIQGREAQLREGLCEIIVAVITAGYDSNNFQRALQGLRDALS